MDESEKSSEHEQPIEEDYDPYLYRVVEKPTTNAETFAHLLKGSLGTGILAMPQAIHHAGLVNGILGTFAIGILCTYCFHVLVRSQYVLCKRNKVPILSYPESMTIALQQGPHKLQFFAPAAPWVIDGFLIFYQLGICCCYVVFVAESLKQVFDNYFETLNIRVHMCIILVPMIGINCVRNLKLLAPFSTLANLLTFVGLGIILSYVLTDVPPISERRMVGPLEDFPLFFGITLFALEAVGVIIALEANMKTPASFRGKFGVLNIGMICIVTLYVFIGIVGYLKYGKDCLGSITLNLPHNEGLANAVKLSMAIAVFISYGLQCYVPINIIWYTYMLKRLKDSEKQMYWEYGLRIVIVLLTFAVAAVIPLLGLFISLIGAFCLSALGIAFPAILEMCVYWHDDMGKYNWIMYKDIFLIIFGCLGLIAGTFVSIRDIVKSL